MFAPLSSGKVLKAKIWQALFGCPYADMKFTWGMQFMEINAHAQTDVLNLIF
jgi:hypothetical protein